jgi:ABC-type amino acid transport substrate-binding protein
MKRLLLLTLRLLASASAGRLEEIHARGVLRVGSTGDYKPFSYRAGRTIYRTGC